MSHWAQVYSNWFPVGMAAFCLVLIIRMYFGRGDD
jgi:hypothetical protein